MPLINSIKTTPIGSRSGPLVKLVLQLQPPVKTARFLITFITSFYREGDFSCAAFHV